MINPREEKNRYCLELSMRYYRENLNMNRNNFNNNNILNTLSIEQIINTANEFKKFIEDANI